MPDVLALAPENGVAGKGQVFVACCKDAYAGIVSWQYEYSIGDHWD